MTMPADQTPHTFDLAQRVAPRVRSVSEQRGAFDTVALLAGAARVIAQQQSYSAALAFWCKTLRDPMAIADWIHFLHRHRAAHGVPSANARDLRKPQRNYGVVGRSVRQRVDALMTHYKLAASRLPPAIDRAVLCLDHTLIGQLRARDTKFDLWLGSSLPYGQKQEGEMTVWLTDASGHQLARMAISFGLGEQGQSRVLIGGLQGLAAHADKRIIVAATRALSGLRPKDAVLVAVQAIAKALSIDDVVAVSNARHVLAAEWVMSRSVISRDYDGFWRERGGEPDPEFGFKLPQPDYAARVAAHATPRLLDRHRAALSAQVIACLS